MSEPFLMIPVDDQVKVEAHLIRGGLPRVAAINHPHPLYGGSMDNNVVMAAMAVLDELGWSVARFNFRGVGGSSGSYADGIGEREDLKAVCRFLRDQAKQPEALCVVGYSFGAWVTMGAAGEGLSMDAQILISPPMDFMSFETLPVPGIPCLITLGERDDFCRLATLRHWLEKQPEAGIRPHVVTFPGVDHFYWGAERLLKEEMREFLRSLG
ncbi:MAG TPA: alpha/beta hydrolase [Syntrophobacteraceae bacterium]|jgi:uncharacterized protein|nr:alpha/beta hydrolase [Syntrophobacteraceae bacterium]